MKVTFASTVNRQSAPQSGFPSPLPLILNPQSSILNPFRRPPE
jgi:hypothetical protein